MSDVKAIMPTDFPSLGAPWLMSSIASTLTRTRVANSVPPFANVLISNVPGPNITLYFAGAKTDQYLSSFDPLSWYGTEYYIAELQRLARLWSNLMSKTDARHT